MPIDPKRLAQFLRDAQALRNRVAETPGQTSALRRAVARGVVVVVSTRTGSGRVPVKRDDGMLGSGDLNPQKARVLLTLALSRSTDPREVAQIFQGQQ